MAFELGCVISTEKGSFAGSSTDVEAMPSLTGKAVSTASAVMVTKVNAAPSTTVTVTSTTNSDIQPVPVYRMFGSDGKATAPTVAVEIPESQEVPKFGVESPDLPKLEKVREKGSRGGTNGAWGLSFEKMLSILSFQLMLQLDSWGMDVFQLSDLASNRPLTAVTYSIFKV